MSIPIINADGNLTNCDNLAEKIPLKLFMNEIRQQVQILILQSFSKMRFRVYAEIWTDFLRCSSLLSLNLQRAVVDTTIDSCLLSSQKLKYQIQSTGSRRNLMNDYPESKHLEKVVDTWQNEFSSDLISAYRFSQRTFKILPFFSEAFVASSNWTQRQRALDNFFATNQYPSFFALEKKIDAIAESLVIVMKQLGLKKPIEKIRLKKRLQKAQDYEFKFKEWVETPHYHAIYLRVIQLYTTIAV